MKNPRRVFLMTLSASSGAFVLGVHAQAQVKLDEKDPQAVALGYVADAAKVDTKKFPKFAAGQNCANCALYQGKAGAASGPCALFPGKDVTAKGWCQAYAKKA